MKTITLQIDRPLGSRHPNHQDMIYPVNYGFVPGVMAADGEEQDVYVLGIDYPVDTFTGQLIAIIHRKNDVEEKWVVVPEGVRFTEAEIRAAIHFQEQFFDTWIEMLTA